MNTTIKYLAIDDEGHSVPIWDHPRKELMAHYGPNITTRYNDDGTLCGYVVRDILSRDNRRVFTLYTLTRWGPTQEG